ncbi:MAG: CRTAC1 family protein [Acidobacteria bacterium]|nr:CRTAC1 family protein [Acidobacteriota bacterium]
MMWTKRMKICLLTSVGICLLAVSCTKRPVPPEKPFRDEAAATGLRFRHQPGAQGKFHLPEIMGSGVALCDFDQDGDLDAFLIQGSPGSSNRFFRNELVPSGKLTFADATTSAGLTHEGIGMGAAIGDIDNDGRPDLLVTYLGRNVLYRNNGNGAFEDVTNEAIALPDRWSTSAAFFDYDRDGWQDLVILNYIEYSIATNQRCFAPTGELDYCTPRVYRPAVAHLFHNDRGSYREVPNAFSAALGPGLGVTVLDANDDGWPDLFVANDSMANHLWINRRDGTFAEEALAQGVAYGEDGVVKAGMGVALGDYDNDGREDLLVLNLMREGASLFRNVSSGNFTDASLATGLHAHTFQYTGFGAGFADFNRDGRLDLFLANGGVTRREEQRGQPYPFLEQNLLLTQETDGRFASAAVGEAAVSRGAAFGDVDNDGDVDVIVNVNNGEARLLINTMQPGNWLAVTASGPGLGLGRRVEVSAPGLPKQVRVIRSAFSYLSASPPVAWFGLAGANKVKIDSGLEATVNRVVRLR